LEAKKKNMVYLIIGISFALIIGSLMWMLPSPKEKSLARLRANAAAAEFHPKFIKFENYVQLIPAHLKTKQIKPQRQLLRYFWQGKSPQTHSRSLFWVFSEKKELLAFLVDGREADKALQSSLEEKIKLGLDAANYLEGLMAMECRDEEGKRTLSLYWPEAGDIDSIDFKSMQIQALQARL
jgi:hypothetical protein